MYAVEVKNLYKTFDKNVILNNIDLEMEAGGFTVLLGPSGCGKSTLLRLIAGLEEVSSGEVHIGDRDVTLEDPKDRDIAMVFQSYALFPHMTVAENIGFGMKINGVKKEEIQARVERVADLLQIGKLLERTPAQLSGGQRQRVAIGRALVRKPKVFLFDEPLSNLDAKLRAEMRLELKKLHDKLKSTIVYVTHDQIEAMTLATRIVLLYKGVIQQDGTPKQIYNQPQHVFVAKFVGSPQINLLNGILTRRGADWFCQLGNHLLPLGSYDFQQTPTEGRKVLLGIRPEHISHHVHQCDFKTTLAVTAFEMTGSEVLAEFEFNDQPLRVKLDAQVDMCNGEWHELHFDLRNMSLFCAVTEQRI